MNITEHFTLAELTRTEVRGVNNAPPEFAQKRLAALAENILEPVRRQFVAPVVVHSAYRSPMVNERVGGSLRSQHVAGEAADFHVIGVDFFTVARWIAHNLDFDQLILEFCDPSGFGRGWLHCSFVDYRDNRKRITVATTGPKYRDILATEIPKAKAA